MRCQIAIRQHGAEAHLDAMLVVRHAHRLGWLCLSKVNQDQVLQFDSPPPLILGRVEQNDAVGFNCCNFVAWWNSSASLSQSGRIRTYLVAEAPMTSFNDTPLMYSISTQLSECAISSGTCRPSVGCSSACCKACTSLAMRLAASTLRTKSSPSARHRYTSRRELSRLVDFLREHSTVMGELLPGWGEKLGRLCLGLFPGVGVATSASGAAPPPERAFQVSSPFLLPRFAVMSVL